MDSQGLFGKIAQMQQEIDERLEEVSDKLAQHTEDSTAQQDQYRRSIEDKFSALLGTTEHHFGELDVWAKRLSNTVAEVENIPTRRVEWHIPGAGSRAWADGAAEGPAAAW